MQTRKCWLIIETSLESYGEQTKGYLQLRVIEPNLPGSRMIINLLKEKVSVELSDSLISFRISYYSYISAPEWYILFYFFIKKGVPILHIIATPFPNQWHKIGDNQNTVHYPTVEKLNKIFRLFVAEYLQLEQVNLWDEAEDGGIIKDDTRKNAKLDSKHTPTTSGGSPSIKMHTEFWFQNRTVMFLFKIQVNNSMIQAWI